MRRNFVIFAVLPALIFIGVLYVFLDGWVESGIEYAGERAVGAKVEIDNLHLTLSPLGMSFERLQIADPKDPWKNLVETRLVRFAMDPAQLLRAKFIVEAVEVNRAVLGTPRKTDGRLASTPSAKPEPGPQAASDTSQGTVQPIAVQAAPSLKKEESNAPSFDLDRIRRELNVDSLVNPRNLLSYRLLDSLEQETRNLSGRWDSSLAAIERAKRRAEEIETSLKALDISGIKSLPSAQGALTTVKGAVSGAREVVNTLDENKRSLTESFDALSSGLRSVDDVASQDFKNALTLAKLPGVDMKGLAELVLGREIMNKAHTYLGYVDLAREKVPQYIPKPSPNQSRRSEGMTIHFPEERSYPKVWVKKVVLSGGTDAQQDPAYFYASGTVTDISNDQRLTGKPLVVKLDATRGGTTLLAFDASFDRRSDVPHDAFAVEASGVPVSSFDVGRSNFLPAKITNALAGARIDVDIPGNKLESFARINFSNLRMTYDREAHGLVERIVQDVIGGVRGFLVNLRVWRNESGSIDVAFTTDLDDLLSSRTRRVVGDEIAKIQNDIRSRVNSQVAAKRKDVEGLVSRKRAEVEARVREFEQPIRAKVAVVEQKRADIEQRVEQEKKKSEGGVKKKAGEVLKGILKK